MTIQADEYKSVVGIDQVYIAEVTVDSSGAYTTGTPEYLAPTASIGLKPKTNQETQYAENKPFDVASSEAETDIEVSVTNLPSELYAKLLGSYFDTVTGTVQDRAGTPPFFALGFRSLKSNDKYRYFWYLKGRFSTPEEGADSKGEKATPKTLKLNFKAIKTTHEWTVNGVTSGLKRIFGDEDTVNFSATGWYTQVQVPGTTTPSALALSTSVPADDEGSASKTANIVLTFNNALAADAIYGAVLVDAAGAKVTVTGTLDATKKILTLTHAALTGSTAHTLTYAVIDIYNQVLSGVVTFTTAA